MKVIKYTIYRNGEEVCYFWTSPSQVDRLNLVLSKLIRLSAKFMPTSSYQFDYNKTEI